MNPYLSIAGYLAGTIDFNEFLQMMTSKMVSLSSYKFCVEWCYSMSLFFWTLQGEKDSKEEILKAFRLFDDDETVN